MEDLQEGSGDSEESLEPSPTGISTGIQSCQVGSERTASGSGVKRKRSEGSIRSRKTRGGPSTDPDQGAFSRIAGVLESREERKRGKTKDDEEEIPSAADCTQFLYSIDEIKEDEELRLICLLMVECPIICSKILTLKDLSTTDLVKFLRMCYNNPPEWLKPYLP